MGEAQLVFGWRTALLLLLSVQCLALAAALALQPRNRTANRILAAFLVVVTGVMTPYTIGFAGFYDAWMGLTFAPFALPLFLAPLLYGYTHALARGAPPSRWSRHLAPGFAQLIYMTGAFLLPFDLKMAWARNGDGPWVSNLLSLGVTVGLVAYSLAALRLLRAYRAGLADQRSDDDRFAARWLGRVLAAMGAATVIWTGWQAWGLATGRFDYFEFFWLYLAFGLIGVALGVEGWRQAGQGFAPLVAAEPAAPAEQDWTVAGADIARRTREAGWWREPELTLPGLARRLGTNSGRVSRAINLGLGMNFSAFVNGLRAEGVAEALRDRPDADLLDLAFDMGFASKASFNRAFRARFGRTPSEYRRQVSDPAFPSVAPELRRDDAGPASG
jgi:AraC-like DNA-binding protein